MALSDLRALAHARHSGTSGTSNRITTGSVCQPGSTQEHQQVTHDGTSGTSGTNEKRDTGREDVDSGGPTPWSARRPDADPWAAGVTHLLGMSPLPGFDGSRWRRICLDCAALLELWGSEMHRLGWTAADAFGVHPDAPYWAYQCMGLGVLLKGGQVVHMTETGAKIECLSGVQHSFVRRCRPGAVPIWTAGPQGTDCASSPLHAELLL